MLLEPPRPRVPDRAGPPQLNTAPPRVRIRRRAPAEQPVEPIEPAANVVTLEDHEPLRVALLIGAFVLAVASRGDVVVLAALLALGSWRRTTAFASSVALAAALLRWGSPSLRAIAGAQAVLGPAGWTGSNAAVASAWLAAVALVASARPRHRESTVLAAVGVAPFAVAAADVVAGPSAAGALGVRIAASVVAFGAALVVSRWHRAPQVACVLAVAALVAAGVSR